MVSAVGKAWIRPLQEGLETARGDPLRAISSKIDSYYLEVACQVTSPRPNVYSIVVAMEFMSSSHVIKS